MRRQDRVQLVPEPAGDDLHAEVEEVDEHRLQVEPLRHGDLGPGGRLEAGHVDVEVGLQRRVLEQVRQRRVGVGAGPQLQDDPDVVGAQVLDVGQLRDLPLADQVADAEDQRVLLDAVGDRRDEDPVRPVAGSGS